MTVNMVRTIEDVLGLTPSSLISAAAVPMGRGVRSIANVEVFVDRARHSSKLNSVAACRDGAEQPAANEAACCR